MTRTGVAGLAIAILITVGCGSPPASEADRPATGTAQDGRFRLQLQTPRTTHRSTDRIEPVALVTYLGPAPTETVYHAASMVGFRIAEVGGSRVMGGGMDLPCLNTPMVAGQTIRFPFAKAGAVAEDPTEGFGQAWYLEPELRLPAGRWQITAYLSASLGDCGGERHEVETAIEIVVEP